MFLLLLVYNKSQAQSEFEKNHFIELNISNINVAKSLLFSNTVSPSISLGYGYRKYLDGTPFYHTIGSMLSHNYIRTNHPFVNASEVVINNIRLINLSVFASAGYTISNISIETGFGSYLNL